jgi:hypothetical protein
LLSYNLTLDEDIEKIGITKEDANKLGDFVDGVKYPKLRGGTVGERTIQVILRLLMLMANDISAIRETLEKRR